MVRDMTFAHPNRLGKKVSLVTGAASGIGLAITERLLAEGATVIGADLATAGLDALATEFGDRLIPTMCDVTDEQSIAAAAGLAAGLGGLDIAVANAGAGTFGMIVEHSADDWRRIIDLCLTGVFLTVKHAGANMNDGGSIVTIASLNAVQPSAGMSAYCAAKAGVVMFSQVAAMELGGRGIRVNAVGPGLIRTNATAGMFAIPPIVEQFVDNTTVGRYGQPAEVAGLVAYLCSDEAAFISGSFHSIDGGAQTGKYPDLPGTLSRLAGG
jgi:NAD(P)-dependent dehydrogenase (short-subunit alcohol dehydrogenase family)